MLQNLPDVLREPVSHWLGRAREDDLLGAWLESPESAILIKVVGCSSYAADMIERRPALLDELRQAGRLDSKSSAGDIAALAAIELPVDLSETEFVRALRWFRHRELVRIIWRDLSGAATVPETLADLSDVADAAICVSQRWAEADLQARLGSPRNESGELAQLVILGMGKLGGRELNFSSDVDLIFCFTEHGETDGARSKSNEEYFRLLAQKIVYLLSQKTSDGFVYRVDVRLRPFGDSGPFAVSMGALEAYLSQHGRDWERYAYVKARILNDWQGAEGFYDEILRPFVYRRYLDYGVFSSLREMKLMIEAEVQRKEFHQNVKLGQGGIREIEFVVQTLQLVRGGTSPELRGKELMPMLERLVRPDGITRQDSHELLASYLFLRRFENCLQAMNDRQTHDVPAGDADRARLVLALDAEDWGSLSGQLDQVRETVSRHFRNIVLHESEGESDEASAPDEAGVFSPALSQEQLVAALGDAGFSDAEGAAERLNSFRDSGFILRLDESGRQRLNTLMPKIIEVSARQSDSREALEGALTIVEAIGRRSAYFSLLNENPKALERLVELCALSRFLVDQIAAHPLLLDELLDPRVFQQAPTHDELAQDLKGRMQSIQDDPERSREALRNFHQAATFRVAVADLSGALPLMKVSDRLTEIGEFVLEGALALARAELAKLHGLPRCVVDGIEREARFGVIAYGKLGGLELGYGSDLDIVFLHDSAGDSQQTASEKPVDNSVFFVRLAQRIIHVLTMSTSSGPLYEVDTRLRPNGKSGLLVSSVAAFERYQSADAWTWEHQALLRGRFVAGDSEIRESFDAIRTQTLTTSVRQEVLKQDVLDMRRRMRSELLQANENLFDLKQDIGGVTDIEFIVQYLILRGAQEQPALVEYSDNVRQLEALARYGVLKPADAQTLANVYRAYRRDMHHLSLAGKPARISRDECSESAKQVIEIWTSVFDDAPG